MSVIVELAIFPVGKQENLSPFIAKAIQIIENSGLPYTLGAMGTCIEGDWHEVMQVVNKCFQELSADNNRLYIVIKADYRKDREQGISQKVESVKKY